MDAFINALQGIVIVLIMISIGFYISRHHWLTTETENFIAKFVTVICLPPYMVMSMLKNFTQKQFLSMVGGLIVPILSITLCCIIAHILGHFFIAENRRGVFASMFYGANTIFIGLPLCITLFGDAGASYVMLYYIVNSAFFWILGVYDIAADGGKKEKLLSLHTIKSICSPPVLGFIVGLMLVLFNSQLPEVLTKSFNYVGNMVTPLAMIFVGIAISKGRFSDISWNKELFLVLLGRFIVSPLTIFFLQRFISLPTLMGQVFVILAGMPAMTNTSIIAKAYGGDYQYAAQATIVSTFLAAFTIPVYMLLIK